MLRWFLMLGVVALLLNACSQDNFVAQPVVSPPSQAPPPANFQQPPPAPPGYPPTYFQPQLPPGYPQAYYPFVPIDNYMRRTPGMITYWYQFWNGWVSYANSVGYQPYDFSAFWYDYCPQAWYGTSYWSLYQEFDQSFYSWMTPGMQLPTSCDPSYFWSDYYGYPYTSFDSNYCSSCYY